MGKKLFIVIATLSLLACANSAWRAPASLAKRDVAQSSESGNVPPATYGVPRSTESPFVQLKEPVAGDLKIYGGYSNGCIGGAQVLPKSGVGYEVQRLSRNRFYGHPSLLSLLERAGQEFAPRTRLLIGDLGMPAGGPTVGGHASHQIGLDVDIWFYAMAKQKKFTEEMRESLYASSLIDKTWRKFKKGAWKKIYGEEVMWFAGQPEVARIFVNAVIKKRLCKDYANDPRLVKVRPWGFHHEHFHVRLNCPSDQPGCVPQAPPTEAECDEQHFGYWYSNEKLQELLHPEPKPPQDVQLPMECKALIGAGQSL
jgi:penicillin-insensitive murein endopeptidase